MPEQDLNQRSDMLTTEEGNVVSSDDLSERETAENCDLAKPVVLENANGSKEPADDSDDEVEPGEISSPKGSEGEKTFEDDCELDFEDDEERTKEIKLADVSTTKIEKSGDDGKDDGECTDEEVDEDLEEGELKDEIAPEPLEAETTSSKSYLPPSKTVCHFYNKGSCFYGNNCRFLHVNHRKGYFSRAGPPDFSPVPPLPEPAFESWEWALHNTKELLRKANKRKFDEPDFESKRFNSNLYVNEKNVPEVENEIPYRKRKREHPVLHKRECTKKRDPPSKRNVRRTRSRSGSYSSVSSYSSRSSFSYSSSSRSSRSKSKSKSRSRSFSRSISMESVSSASSSSSHSEPEKNPSAAVGEKSVSTVLQYLNGVNLQNDESSKPVRISSGVKSPLPPSVSPVITKPASVSEPKKSASNRREELLKQLKAVEDAIARKRGKFG